MSAYGVGVGHEYAFRSDRTAERAADARNADREPETVLVVEDPPRWDEDEPLGWLVSLLVEHNASEG